MPGTVRGGRKAAVTNKANLGDDFYAAIGQAGGVWRGPKGFSVNKALAREAGKIGGQASKRGKAGIRKQTRTCKFCGDSKHLTIACEARMRAVAARNVRNEEIELMRDKNRSIMSKWAEKWNRK